ncbi:hypothetical protein Poli38472_009906 [Pythium oligandrum]|uniref:RWP-RK domain-containing protein n=1 Tax=Pythium oligandrum TaxID=41045 RepID=A0A8K1C9C9_PYTOL|nr:hypothetical protein Poli38472_009906 [Pythium oligandrum]|eukprot:TMW58347.1 hypothetical protein Poli38472_009906 [Pythium oligandrum]
MAVVAKELGVCITLMKKICRRNGLVRWPHRRIRSLVNRITSLQVIAANASGAEKKRFASQISALREELSSVIQNPNEKSRKAQADAKARHVPATEVRPGVLVESGSKNSSDDGDQLKEEESSDEEDIGEDADCREEKKKIIQEMNNSEGSLQNTFTIDTKRRLDNEATQSVPESKRKAGFRAVVEPPPPIKIPRLDLNQSIKMEDDEEGSTPPRIQFFITMTRVDVMNAIHNEVSGLRLDIVPATSVLYTFQPVHTLPTADLSITLGAVLLRRSADTALNQRIVSLVQRSTRGLYILMLISCPCAVTALLTRNLTLRILASLVVLLSACPVIIFAFISLSWDIVKLLLRTFEFWFLTSVNLINTLVLGNMLCDSRVLAITAATLFYQLTLFGDANLHTRLLEIRLLVFGAPAMFLIVAGSVFSIIPDLQHTSMRLLRCTIDDMDMLLTGNFILAFFTSLKVHRNRRYLSGKIPLQLVQCQMYFPDCRLERRNTLHLLLHLCAAPILGSCLALFFVDARTWGVALSIVNVITGLPVVIFAYTTLSWDIIKLLTQTFEFWFLMD